MQFQEHVVYNVVDAWSRVLIDKEKFRSPSSPYRFFGTCELSVIRSKLCTSNYYIVIVTANGLTTLWTTNAELHWSPPPAMEVWSQVCELRAQIQRTT